MDIWNTRESTQFSHICSGDRNRKLCTIVSTQDEGNNMMKTASFLIIVINTDAHYENISRIHGCEDATARSQYVKRDVTSVATV